MQSNAKDPTLWRYLLLLACLPFLVWQAAQSTLSMMEVEFARQHPAMNVSMQRACEAGSLPTHSLARCEVRRPVALAHGLALGVLLTLAALLSFCATLPVLPKSFQIKVLRRATILTGAGLVLTWLMTATNVAALGLAAWALPLAWWGRDLSGFAAILVLLAFCRLFPHARLAYRLMTDTRRFVVGQIAQPLDAPEIQAMIDRSCQRLGVPPPQRLILGLRPGVRLETGRFLLEPRGQRVRGRSLYVGLTLAQSLNMEELENLIESALSRAAGPYGTWLPEAQDAWQNASEVLHEANLARSNGELKGNSDAARLVFGCWLTCWANLMRRFEEEDGAAAYRRQAAGSSEMERERAGLLIEKAQRAWTDGVFAHFMLALSVGEKAPPTQERFAAALQEAGETGWGQGPCWRTLPALYADLVAKDCEWMAATGQVAIIGQSWELLGIHGAHKQDAAKSWDYSMRLNP